jgi:hypothetical protein
MGVDIEIEAPVAGRFEHVNEPCIRCGIYQLAEELFAS